jgi:hypothetical protein
MKILIEARIVIIYSNIYNLFSIVGGSYCKNRIVWFTFTPKRQIWYVGSFNHALSRIYNIIYAFRISQKWGIAQRNIYYYANDALGVAECGGHFENYAPARCPGYSERA